jgi:hypothetical protein
VPTIDFNGTGRWSPEGIAAKYREHSERLQIPMTTDLTPRTYSKGDDNWVYPVMEKVIAGIASGDPACAEIGIDFISENGSFPFGMVLKTYTARALRRANLTESQRERIRRRIVSMLVEGYVPKEYREYAKLLRKVGLGSLRAELGRADKANPQVAKYLKYFTESASA